MPYVIKNLDTGKYVAKPGGEHSYSNDIENIRVFRDSFAANKEKCGNEVVVNVEDLILDGWSFVGYK